MLEKFKIIEEIIETNFILCLFLSALMITIGIDIIKKIKEACEDDQNTNKAKEIIYHRNRYMVENLISYLKDNELLADFTEDRDIDWQDWEIQFYELKEEDITNV